jgi:hypothetical protein
MSFEFVKRHDVRRRTYYWCEIDEYKSAGGEQFLLAHIRVTHWSPSVCKQLRARVQDIPHYLPCSALRVHLSCWTRSGSSSSRCWASASSRTSSCNNGEVPPAIHSQTLGTQCPVRLKEHKKSSRPSRRARGAPQAGALTSAFANAQDAYGKSSTATAPTDFVAGMTPEQLATFRDALGYANGTTVPGQNAATGAALSGAGTSRHWGPQRPRNFDPSSANNPAALIDAANKYVAGQDIDAQVNNAMLNARQTARDVTLPGINQNAAMTGNTNSSRTGIAEGLVERGLAQQAADLGGSLRSNAFKDGLTLASSNANANNALEAGCALSSAAGMGTNAATSGVNASSKSIATRVAARHRCTTAGAGLQSADQLALDNLLKQYQSKCQLALRSLRASWGSLAPTTGAPLPGTETTTKTPSAWEVIGGLLGAGGQARAAAGGLGWKPFANDGLPNRTSAWLNFAQRSRDEGGLGLAPHQAAGMVGNLVTKAVRTSTLGDRPATTAPLGAPRNGVVIASLASRPPRLPDP